MILLSGRAICLMEVSKIGLLSGVLFLGGQRFYLVFYSQKSPTRFPDFLQLKKTSLFTHRTLFQKATRSFSNLWANADGTHFKELPYTFQNRKDGESKLGLKQITQYIHQIFDIAIFPGRAQDEIKRMICFGIVGITGIAVNMIALAALKNYLPLLGASFIAIELSIISNYILNDMWTFKENNTGTWLHRMISYNGVAVGGMIINMAVLAILTTLGMWYILANLIGIVLGFAWNFIGNRKLTWKN